MLSGRCSLAAADGRPLTRRFNESRKETRSGSRGLPCASNNGHGAENVPRTHTPGEARARTAERSVRRVYTEAGAPRSAALFRYCVPRSWDHFPKTEAFVPRATLKVLASNLPPPLAYRQRCLADKLGTRASWAARCVQFNCRGTRNAHVKGVVDYWIRKIVCFFGAKLL